MSFVLLAITMRVAADTKPSQPAAAMIPAGITYTGCVPKDTYRVPDVGCVGHPMDKDSGHEKSLSM